MYPISIFIQFDMENSIWLEYLAQSAAFMHCSLFITQAYLDWCAKDEYGREAMRHLTKTLRLLQESLADPDSATSDATIAVVQALVTVADLLGDMDLAEKHLQGLYRLVSLRGGLSFLAQNKQLQIKVCR